MLRTAKSCGPGTRCWCQVRGGFAGPTGPLASHQSVDDGDKRNSSPGRARRKPLKPLRREGRIASAEPVCSCAFFCASCTRDRGCSVHPVFPAPSVCRGARLQQQLGRDLRRENAESQLLTRISPPFSSACRPGPHREAVAATSRTPVRPDSRSQTPSAWSCWGQGRKRAWHERRYR
jgi:hypothetical protein